MAKSLKSFTEVTEVYPYTSYKVPALTAGTPKSRL